MSVLGKVLMKDVFLELGEELRELDAELNNLLGANVLGGVGWGGFAVGGGWCWVGRGCAERRRCEVNGVE